MADKDTIGSVVDDTTHTDAEVKVEKKASILPSILKWVAIVLAVTIFVIAVTIITITIMSKKGTGFTEYPTSPEYRHESEILTYTKLDKIQTNISGEPPATVAVEIHLGYSQDDKETSSEISGRSIELLDFLRSYFKHKTYNELENNEEAIKIEIRNLINDNILTKGKIKSVAFRQYDIIRQE